MEDLKLLCTFTSELGRRESKNNACRYTSSGDLAEAATRWIFLLQHSGELFLKVFLLRCCPGFIGILWSGELEEAAAVEGVVKRFVRQHKPWFAGKHVQLIPTSTGALFLLRVDKSSLYLVPELLVDEVRL